METLKKLFIIGWDGAPHSLIKKLLEEEKLPNLSSIVADGVMFPLETVPYIMSSCAWSTMVTGKNAGKHGIFDFYGNDFENDYFRKPINASFREDTPFWEVMGRYGVRVGIINVPFTYPASEVNGFMVAGMLSPSVRDDFFIYPTDLLKDYDKLDDYMIDVSDTKPTQHEDYLRDVMKMIENRTEMILYLIESQVVDVLFAVYTAPDRVQHWFWHFLDDSHPYRKNESEDSIQKYGDVITNIYAKLDKDLGVLIDKFKEKVRYEPSIIVLSDHGMASIKKVFDVNNYLRQKNYLTFKPIDRQRTIKRQTLYHKMSYIYGKIEWSKTQAYSIGKRGAIYINLKGREPKGIVEKKNYEKMVKELVNTLRKERRVDRIYSRNELFHGRNIEKAPDILLFLKEGCFPFGYAFDIDENESELIHVNDREDYPFATGIEAEDGIICIRDKNIDVKAENLYPKMQDLAPNILYIFEMPLLQDMDGQVLTKIYKKNRPIDYIDLKYVERKKVPSEKRDEIIYERLKRLGYQ